MRIALLLCFLCLSLQAMADLVVMPRYDYIQGTEEELSNRFILKAKLNASKSYFGVYVEGFGEYEMNEDQAAIRRSPAKGYLQEGYVEFKKESFYVRLGRQALRWSEMWTLPSLDIWTGRSWNRLFLDPLVDQYTHPTGVSFSYAAESFSVDLVGISEVAETTYPMPIPQPAQPEGTSFGGRLKWAWGNFGLSTLAAKIVDKNHAGFTANYAMEHAVPKIEYGWVQDNEADFTVPRESIFATVGVDVFWGNWILMPQVTAFEVNGPNKQTDIQNNIYLSGQWNPRRHDLQFQFFRNVQTQDQFANFSYGYNLTDAFTLSGFYQNYEGQDGGLYTTYQAITGGAVFGVRAELSGNLPF